MHLQQHKRFIAASALVSNSMLYRKVRGLLQPTAKLIANLACRTGGIPSIEQLETQLQERRSELDAIDAQQKALYRVISKIRASLDLDMIFQTTTKETCKLLRIERIAVYRFFDDWGGEFVEDFEFAEPGWDFGTLGQNTVWNDSYLQEHQGGRYRANECLMVSDVYTEGLSQCHLDVLAQFHIRAYATAPIFIGQKLWGVLAAYQHSQPHQWQHQEIQFLSQVANHLGFAVKQAELMTRTERKAEDFRLLNEQQEILFGLIAEIRESLDLNVLFKTTVREVRKALRTDRVGIFQFDVDSNYTSGELVAENVLPEYDSALAIKINDHCFGEGYAAQYHQGQILVMSDILNAGLQQCYLDMLETFQVRAQIVVPLMKGDDLWGLLCVHQCDRPRVWESAEITFIKQLAAQFSVALRHADLLTQSYDKAKQLDQALQDLKQANEKLEELSNLDSLTQISNRRFFDKALENEWKRLLRTEKYLSLILFDIDHFKIYNDCYGHVSGDECLIKITRAAQFVLKRSSDVLARYGGEEFAVILPDTDQAGAIKIAEQIRDAIKSLQIPNKCMQIYHPYVTISLGIASQIPTADQSPQDVIRQADQALYQAKAKGRDMVVCAPLTP
ncbi:sensor domain-containing diguanylate cyclase [Leptolyngbya sp. CCNP1308]|uniref:sensor domain-containing diguanylate cyclase n=1 Tax=Leptolyngbya sp. CCNP1308 TaxID=3110255 RepID=UPI002B211D84|nr:sensor domain-containing diguanylate cyclase [Leptolyngbya sp. CCNP1308]MEA5447056.1 sensor domain-containing diguanylate cyclase [Leptolyngbya sp. CCNP1308]